MDELTYAVDGTIARITIAREAARNAISGPMVLAMTQALDRADADPAVRCVVVTGEGSRVFCSGADLTALQADGFLDAHESRRAFAQMLLRFQQLKKPSIARVNGHALAGGVGLMLACDLAVAADSSSVGVPEVDRGLFPMMVLALLQRHVGRKRALELLLTGDRLPAAQAREWGLLNRVVLAADLDTEVNALAAKLSGKSLAVLALGRRSFFTAEDLPLAQSLEFLVDQLSLNVLVDDAMEGVTAFLEKRPAKWSDR
ncbi:MAG: enoyl-CoA hydratase/isomerase family protein [Archangium sp.]